MPEDTEAPLSRLTEDDPGLAALRAEAQQT